MSSNGSSTLRVSQKSRKRVNNIKNNLDITQEVLVSKLLDLWEEPHLPVFKKTKNDVKRLSEMEDKNEKEIIQEAIEEKLEKLT